MEMRGRSREKEDEREDITVIKNERKTENVVEDML